jgi:type IV pilus assembly protein PilF
MYRLAGFMVWIVLLSACTTESTSSIKNFEGNTTVSSQFDPELAAQKRVAAARLYLQQNNLERAKFHLDRAYQHKEDYPDLHFTLGYYYQMAKNYDLADKAFRQAIRLDDKNAEYKNGYGQFLCVVKKYDQAEDYFNMAIHDRTYSNTAMALVNAGNCKAQQNKLDEAVDYYRRALNINPKLPAALLEMAQYEYLQGRYDRTVQYLNRFREVAPLNPRSLWIGLRAAHKLGDKDAVSSYALKLQNLYPDSAETLEYLNSREQWQ